LGEVSHQFDEKRCRILDAFAELEREVCDHLLMHQKSAVRCASRPLGQKLKDLAALKASPTLPKKTKSELERFASELTPLLEVRADIVHAKRRGINFDGQPAALYLNASQADEAYPKARIMTLEKHDELIKEINQRTKALSALKPTPPPSPPRPAPAAAAGPES